MEIPAKREAKVAEFKGRLFRRGDAGYELARTASVWHAGVPNRMPEIIIQAASENDVVNAVKLARHEGRKITVRSGGHSWAGNHLRDGCLLLDLSLLQDFSIDSQGMTATVQPGRKGSELNAALAERGLFFPTGHCTDVGVGGYLLQGGFGWRGREFGPACASVIGIDVVTADGELRYADEQRDAELFWAARGAGPGFFAIVTRFHLKVYPLDQVALTSFYIYPPEVWEEFYRWAHEVCPGLPIEVDVNLLTYRDQALSAQGPVTSVSVVAFTDALDRAREDIALFENCPVRNRALVAKSNMQTNAVELTHGTDEHFPTNKRFLADTMWYHGSFDRVLPGLREIKENLPPAPSHFLWFPWTPISSRRTSMAFSLDDDFYIGLYTAWDDAADDDKYRKWVTERMRALEPVGTGMALADENLINRPARFVSDENLWRLDEIRTKYDPERLFHAWLGRPW